MSEWKETRLRDITIGNGTYGIAAPAVPKDNNKYTYLRITDINDDGSLNFSDLKSVDDPKANKYLLEPNDIVFARTGNSTGRSYFYDGSAGELVYAGFLIKFSLDSHKVNPKILKYYTHSKVYYDWVAYFDSGATRGNINAKTFAEMPVTLPSRNTQDKVVAILSSLDEKIETNRKINARLEELAQALFKSWFIDFEPFGGQMPEDWETVPINDMVETIIGGDWGKEEETGSFTKKVMCIRGADLNNIRIGEKGKAPIRYILNKNFKQKALSHHDIIVEISGGSPTQSTGRIAMISSVFSNNYDNSLICTNFCKALKIKKTYSHYFYYLWNYLYDNKIMFIYENGSNGLKNLNLMNLLDRELCNIPTEKVASDFYKVIESIFLKIQRTGAESTRLAALRDTLLPKLMSGELIPE